jgi:hypothetical protein
MVMVAAIFMGAAIRPRPPDVKFFHVIPGRREADEPGNDALGQITGFHGAGITR